MNLLTVLYVILVVAGIAWVVHRLRTYVSQQRERESMWIEMASEDEFQSYVKDLGKTASPNKPGPKQPSTGGKTRSPAPHGATHGHDGVAKHTK